MTSRVVLVLGGVRSGKSDFAQQLAVELEQQTPGREILYVATGVASDPDMAERIQRHRRSRPAHWSTLEEPLELSDRLTQHILMGQFNGANGGVLIDSVDVWVANLLFMGNEQETKDEAEARVGAAIETLLDAVRCSSASFVFVSSEVGQSLVPPDPLGRKFQDIMGLVNQRVAAAADQVYLLVAGIPNVIKPSETSPLGGE